MANRNRTSPLHGAQNDIFRGVEESRGSLLNAQGGTRGSDVGNTKPLAVNEENEEGSPAGIAPTKRKKKR